MPLFIIVTAKLEEEKKEAGMEVFSDQKKTVITLTSILLEAVVGINLLAIGLHPVLMIVVLFLSYLLFYHLIMPFLYRVLVER